MSDSIPSATEPQAQHQHQHPSTSAEDRKAAAALSSLNTTEITTEPDSSVTQKQPSSAEQEALGKAMSRLEIAAGQKHGTTGTGRGSVETKKAGVGTGVGVGVKKKGVGASTSNVKVSGEDVGLLVNELDLSKIKATELLKANEGDVRRAIRAFVRPGVSRGSVVGA